jgi:hypothetical protein
MAATRSLLATTGLLAAATLLTVGTASATGSVLTYGSPGGTAVATGDVITASSDQVTISTTSGGSTGVTCDQSSFSAAVTSNPAAPGTATENLNALSFGSCTSNILGVTGVQSITPNGLPLVTTVTSAGDVTVQGPLSTTAVLSTVLGSATCVYTASSMSGTADNSTNSITFTNQPYTLSSGASLCPTNGYLTATYTPGDDSSVSGDPGVFVN